MKGNPSVKEYAECLSSHDWFFAMSDDHGVWMSGERALSGLVGQANMSSNHKRLFDLATSYYTQMESAEEEPAWRWAGAYLWVHGVRVSHLEAKDKFIASSGGEDANYRVHWEEVTKVIRESSDREHSDT